MTQSTKSETQKQIEWEIAIQDTLKEVFEEESENPCREIPMTKPCKEIPMTRHWDRNTQNDFGGFNCWGTQTGRTSSDKPSMSEVDKTIFKRYGVGNKKELFKKLYSHNGETWDAMCERIAKQANEMSQMDFQELETKVIVTFLTLLQKVKEEREKKDVEIDPDAE